MSTENTTTTATTTTAGAATTTTDPAAGGATTGAQANWYDSFQNAELKGYIANKQFKSPEVLAEAYKNFEGLRGVSQDRILTLPEKADAPEWAGIYNRLGRPEKADGYKIPVPEGDKGEFAKQAAIWFHEAGLTQRQAEMVAKKWNEHAAASQKVDTDAIAQKHAEEVATLQREWGAAHKQNVELGQLAARKFGFTEEKMAAIEKILGYSGTMKMFHEIGAGLGEHAFQGSGQGGGAGGFKGIPTPDQAKAKIAELRADNDFVSRYVAGDHLAREEMERLHKQAYPEGMH